MHSSTHPNQVRSACERCRRQKLRCLRDPDSNPSCVRCARLGFPCESGSQRKVGRPPKKDASRRKPSKTDKETSQNLEVVVSSASPKLTVPRIEDLTDELLTVDWSLPVDPSMAYVQSATITPDQVWTIPRELSPPDSEDSGTKEVRCSDALFQTLSRIHVELRAVYDVWTRQAANMDFDTFFCTEHTSFKPIASTRAILQLAQQFLLVLKAMHHRIGTRPATMKGPPQGPHGVRSGWTWSPMISYLTLNSSENENGVSPSAPKIDSSSAFLVVSCFVMLIKSLESLFAMTHARLNDLSDGPIRSGLAMPEMMFIDIPIVEFSSQSLLFAEGVLHLLSQINVVLGFPSRWSGRSIWTGLLSTQRYRDLLNKELGYVDGLWSTRPFRLTETIIMTKDLLQELAMMGYA